MRLHFFESEDSETLEFKRDSKKANWIEFKDSRDHVRYFNFETGSTKFQVTEPDRSIRYGEVIPEELSDNVFNPTVAGSCIVKNREVIAIVFRKTSIAKKPDLSTETRTQLGGVYIRYKSTEGKETEELAPNLELVRGCVNYTTFQELLQAALTLEILKVGAPSGLNHVSPGQSSFKVGDVVFTVDGSSCKISQVNVQNESTGFRVTGTTLDKLYKDYYPRACANAYAMAAFILSTYKTSCLKSQLFEDWRFYYQSHKANWGMSSILNPTDVFIGPVEDINEDNVESLIKVAFQKEKDSNTQCLFPFSLKLNKVDVKDVQVDIQNYQNIESVSYEEDLQGFKAVVKFIETGLQITFTDTKDVKNPYKRITFRNFSGKSEKPSVYFDANYAESLEGSNRGAILGKGFQTLKKALRKDSGENQSRRSNTDDSIFDIIIKYIENYPNGVTREGITIDNSNNVEWLSTGGSLKEHILSLLENVSGTLKGSLIYNDLVALKVLFNACLKKQLQIATPGDENLKNVFVGLYPYVLVEKDLKRLRQRYLAERTCTTRRSSRQIVEELISKLFLHNLDLNPMIHYKSIGELTCDAVNTTNEIYKDPFRHNVWHFGEKGVIYTTLCYVNECFKRNYEKEPNAVVIDGLFVDENYRSQGIGKKLLSDVLRDLKNEYPDLDLLTFINSQDSKAIEFFTKNGFKVKYSAKETVLKYEPLKFTVNTKPKQKIHGCLDWNSFLGISLENKAVLRIRDRCTNEVISQLIVCVTQQAEGWILCFVTNPKYRGQGYGSKLLRKAEKYLQQFGVERICLHAQKEFESKLIPFYLNQNYRILGRDPRSRNEMTFYKDVV